MPKSVLEVLVDRAMRSAARTLSRTVDADTLRIREVGLAVQTLQRETAHLMPEHRRAVVFALKHLVERYDDAPRVIKCEVIDGEVIK